MPPSKGPFSANIHPIIPKTYVPIPQGMCDWQMVGGGPSENARVGAQNPSKITLSTLAGTTETWFNATFQGPILCEYTSDHFQTFCAYTSGHVRSENGGGTPPKMHGLGPKIHLKSPLAPQPETLKLNSMPPSKGPFSANIHPITPKLSVPIPEGMCFRKMVGG